MAREMGPRAALEQLVIALNEHDLETLVACFHPDYQSEQPVHPERGFVGRDRVAENWGWVFEHYRDFRADLIDYAIQDSTIWTEWRWNGTDPHGQPMDVRGVMILRLECRKFRSGRLYLESVSPS